MKQSTATDNESIILDQLVLQKKDTNKFRRQLGYSYLYSARGWTFTEKSDSTSASIRRGNQQINQRTDGWQSTINFRHTWKLELQLTQVEQSVKWWLQINQELFTLIQQSYALTFMVKIINTSHLTVFLLLQLFFHSFSWFIIISNDVNIRCAKHIPPS